MSLKLNPQEHQTLWDAAKQEQPSVISADELATTLPMPASLGCGGNQEIELQPGVELCLFDRTYHHKTTVSIHESPHLVQFMVYLTGTADSGDFVYQNADRGYIGGSGIQRPLQTCFPQGQRLTGVNIHLQPQLLFQLFGNVDGALPPELQPLVPGADQLQRVLSPRTTAAIRSVVRQMMNCPFAGGTKRLYLQGKVLELMTLQLQTVGLPDDPCRVLKPETMAQVQQAAAVLRSHLENPPGQTTLARQVGVSDRTLRRGFRQVFGTTVLGYLTEQRLTLAELLLRDTEMTVTEVAHRCGCSNPGHFAGAFRRRFGITPRQCALGMLSQGDD